MKTKASSFFKQMVSAVVAAVKAKSTAVRVKTSALKTRLLIFGILRNKKLLMAAINHKIHAIMGQQEEQQQTGKQDLLVNGDGGGKNKAIVLYSAPSYSFSAELGAHEVEAASAREQEDSDDYLSHSLFAEEDEEEDELVSAPGSVIDVMRDARDREREAAGGGAEFRLEDEIDHVADVFIRRIHRQLKLQKLDSFKRFCEMLERGA
ncbi:uncharacterized protein LOC120640712 [Panicum virgatum]|uniref:Uncharacterized protein n=1 Tax=Panicum virgatum TaxID=38727 RepID=A0A8T0QFH8_PANVG|nr:uncharacterized protein LOC120640712 [Panicum virgatum]KAG2571589.1 hypothetical protein PVAP13_7KG134700 [Panicum virgatum]